MKVTVKKLNQPLIGLMGNKLMDVIKDDNDNDQKIAMTLKNVMVGALVISDGKEVGSDKIKFGNLAAKIYSHEGDEIELDVQEMSDIQKRIDMYYPTITVHAVHKILEEKEEVKPKK